MSVFETRQYTYAELCRMRKKRVLRLAGFTNMKDAIRSGIHKNIDGSTSKLSKKFIAKLIAKDK